MNWVLWIAIVSVVVIGMLACVGLFLPKTMRGQCETKLPQSREVVWKTILDYQAYPSWQSGLKEVRGIRQGEQVQIMDMTITLPSSGGQWGWIEVWGNYSDTVYLFQVIEEQPPSRVVIREEAVDYGYRAVRVYELTTLDSQMTVMRATWEKEQGPVSRSLSWVFKEKAEELEYFLANLKKKLGEA